MIGGEARLLTSPIGDARESLSLGTLINRGGSHLHMSKSVSWIVVVVGVIVLLMAIFAGQLGLGGTTWGLKHIVTLVVGLVLIAVGLFTALRPSGVGA